MQTGALVSHCYASWIVHSNRQSEREARDRSTFDLKCNIWPKLQCYFLASFLESAMHFEEETTNFRFQFRNGEKSARKNPANHIMEMLINTPYIRFFVCDFTTQLSRWRAKKLNSFRSSELCRRKWQTQIILIMNSWMRDDGYCQSDGNLFWPVQLCQKQKALGFVHILSRFQFIYILFIYGWLLQPLGLHNCPFLTL